jgi:glutaredoxin
MKKLILWLTVFVAGIFFLASPSIAQEDQVTVHFFWGQGCPHCAKEKEFLRELKDEYPQVVIKDYEIGQDNNAKLLQEAGEKLDVQIPGVPFTIIGEHYVVGYHNDQTTGQKIEEHIKCAIETGCHDVFGEDNQASLPNSAVVPENLNVPILGQIKTKELSLPALSIILGALDGFNPCAMWTLLFLISLLLGMENKKRMWILGVAFIVTSAFVYFMIMAAWLNFFLLLGMVIWIRLAIGLVALAAGGYNLREFWVNKDGGCKVTGDEKRRRVFDKIKDITHRKSFVLALGGIILLALAVNVVELICSAGLPAVFTQVLAINNLPTWRYYLYIAIYIFFFMIDDLFVFFAAMITMHMTGISTKYSRYSNLIGGILMFIIGLLLLFKPSWLMFG